MNDDAQRLLMAAEISAERSIAYVRCAIGISVSIFFFVVVAPTLDPDNPALDLIPYFATFCTAYFLAGLLTFVFAHPGRFRPWMTWVLATLDILFWFGLLLATVLIIELPGSYVIALPPALIVFILLALVALRNNPWLQAYCLVLVVAAFIALYRLAPTSISRAIEDVDQQIGFFELPLNVVRLAMVGLTGVILVFVAIRTRRLLHGAIEETVQRANLSRFLPTQISDRLAQSDREKLLSGTSQDAAVLFVDMRGFTTLAEGMQPAALGRFLANYREIVSAEIHNWNGIVDKFVGDSVMAVFGAPDSFGNDAANALACSSAIVGAVERWSADRRTAGLSGVSVGVGVHWGEVFCGAIGESDRLEFTVLGDTVNIASRLEQITKDAGMPIVASGPLLAQAGLHPERDNGWRPIDNARIRGRRGTIPIFGRHPQ